MIISTGVANEEEIELAINTCKEVGNNDITLLKCTSQYPATIEDANLITIPSIKEKFGVKVGVSDHTMGDIVATTAVALGAKVVEKHYILDRSLGGPDSSFSMEPNEFKQLVDRIRDVEKTMGKIKYDINDKDIYKRRSLFAVADIKEGELFTEENVRSLRPGIGLHPKFYSQILNTPSKHFYKKGDPIKNN